MKLLLLFYLMMFPLREVENVKISIPAQHQGIFRDYSNANFSQKIIYDVKNHEITAYIRNSNFRYLALNFRIFPDRTSISKYDPKIRAVVDELLKGDYTFESYFKNILFFLKKNITYSTAPLKQDPVSVITNGKANCVGYSNLVQVLLDAASIKNKFIRGFYLKQTIFYKRGAKRKKYRILSPVPHRWVEICLADGSKFFFDPQHQTFSANYIATKRDINFKEIKRFTVKMIKKSKKLIN